MRSASRVALDIEYLFPAINTPIEILEVGLIYLSLTFYKEYNRNLKKSQVLFSDFLGSVVVSSDYYKGKGRVNRPFINQI